MLKIHLIALDDDLTRAWQDHCGDLPFVEVFQGNIFDVTCDAVVSPANSFGFMDGGIDRLYSHRFGWHVQERLQALIRERHGGELLVGTAELVETDDVSKPFLIAAPTMRVPTILRDTVNPFLAARAVLRLIRFGHAATGPFAGEPVSELVRSVAFPGLGTGVGRVPPEICARQVRAAIEDVLLRPDAFPTSWHDAQARHQRLYRDHVTDLQRES